MLYYRTYKKDESSPWVTLIHGAGGSSAVWFKQLKEYKRNFNILLVDLRGHGKSKEDTWQDGDTFRHIAEEVVAVLDDAGVHQSHFIGISLGTVITQTIALDFPERVQSMTLGGAVTKLNLRTKFYLTLGHIGKYFLPFIFIYRLFAWIMMPRANHKEARNTFVSQAKKMKQDEFLKWYALTRKVSPFLAKLQQSVKGIPTMFVMGEQDRLFIGGVEAVKKAHPEVIYKCLPDAGHVVNIDDPERFNQLSIEFIHANNETIETIEYKDKQAMG